jgi:hypothetical protein
MQPPWVYFQEAEKGWLSRRAGCSIDKATFRRLLVRWTTDANLSFRLLEHVALHELFDYLNLLVYETSVNLTHKTIRAKVIHEFNTYKAYVIDTLLWSPSKVHIAFDGWTSRNRHSFSINAFFLDDETFQPRKILLGLPNVAMAHTGEISAQRSRRYWKNSSLYNTINLDILFLTMLRTTIRLWRN